MVLEWVRIGVLIGRCWAQARLMDEAFNREDRMKILLIGATGQIGYALTTALATSDHQLSALVRNRGKLRFPSNLEIMHFARFDAPAFKRALVNVDHVIYAAGMPEQFVFDDDIFERVNVSLLRLFLEQIPDNVKHVTYISTYEVFEDRSGIIRESHPLADARQMSPYYRSMIEAYQLVRQFDAGSSTSLTTIHPAAVYGGRNTNQGFTNYIENLLHKRFWRLPFIIEGRFPLVHVNSLTDAIIRSLDVPGRFIVSDEMTTLREIARTVRSYADSYVPLTAPASVARLGTYLLEALSHVTRRPPMMARVQIEFITKGWEPQADRAMRELGWRPLGLARGIQQYLREKR